MRLLLIGFCSLCALGLAEWLRRRHERLTGPYYRQQLDAWARREPQIPPAKVPALKALQVTHAPLPEVKVAKPAPLREVFKKKA